MSKLIYFVDDDKMIINLLEYTFQSRQQYDVKSFESGEECLLELDQGPDLIVLDHQLSVSGKEQMNGIEVLGKIKESKPELPVIVLTAYGNDALFQEFSSLGAIYCLSKDDYFIDNLIDRIGKVFN